MDLIIRPIGAIWFHTALLCSMVFVTFAVVFAKSIKSRYPDAVLPGISILLFTAGFISAKFIWLPFSIQAGACSMIFYLYHENKDVLGN